MPTHVICLMDICLIVVTINFVCPTVISCFVSFNVFVIIYTLSSYRIKFWIYIRDKLNKI